MYNSNAFKPLGKKYNFDESNNMTSATKKDSLLIGFADIRHKMLKETFIRHLHLLYVK